jgi:CheY-like chemotaxis protein
MQTPARTTVTNYSRDGMVERGFTKLNLVTANVLIVGDRASEQDILAQILMGFGVAKIHRMASEEDAFRALSTEHFDLALIDASIRAGDGYELITSTRRLSQQDLKQVPIILVCGHIRKAEFCRARDCGANFLLTKPISAQVLFDRILWMTRDRRSFVECPAYAGPDRRVKAYGPPVGVKGRRCDDLSEHVGEAKDPNLSQDAVDGFFSAKKAVV